MKDTHEVLANVKNYLNQYFLFDRQEDAEICSLYAMFTYVSDRCNATPFLMINGKTGTGKSRLAGNLIAICKSPVLVNRQNSTFSYIHQILEYAENHKVASLLIEEVDCYENSPIFIEMRLPKIFVAVHPQYFLSNWCITINLKNVSNQQLVKHNIPVQSYQVNEEAIVISQEINEWSKRFIRRDFWFEIVDPRIYLIEAMKKFGYISIKEK